MLDVTKTITAVYYNGVEIPIPSGGYDYCLRADTLEWELVELPPIFSNDNEDERI